MAAKWLPNLEEFFDSFCRMLTDGINNLNSEDDRSIPIISPDVLKIMSEHFAF